jgi:hypothetical protein
MRKYLPVVAAMLMTLQGCTNTRSSEPTSAELTQFNAGSAAVLVANISGNIDCNEGMILALHLAGAPKNELINSAPKSDGESSEPVVLVVPAGNYKINGALCFDGTSIGSLRTLAAWFGGIDVKAGEVVYLGTLDIRMLHYHVKKTALQKMFFANNDADYAAFQFKDESADVAARLRVKHPDLAARMVFRSPPQFVTAEDYVAALDRAYAPKPDGSLPTPEEADARVPGELEKVRAAAAARLHADPNQ